ncbi:hypothetical protein H4R34_005680, partial [Dimargaris verticillata]
MQWTTLTLAIALCHGALAKPFGDLPAAGSAQPVGNGVEQLVSDITGTEMNASQQPSQNAWVTHADILEGRLVHSTTVSLEDICQVVRFPTARAESGEQSAPQAPAPLSTLGDQADQPVCFRITADEWAQNICNSPQPEDQVTVVVIDDEATLDTDPNADELDGP